MEIVEMKELVRRKLNYIAQCIENDRTLNIAEDLKNVVSMVVELSQIGNVDETLDILESAINECSCMLNDQTTLIPALAPILDLEKGRSGRPHFLIPPEILEYFLKNSFKISDMAKMLNISKRTVERRLQQYSLSVSQTYSKLSDAELDEIFRTLDIGQL